MGPTVKIPIIFARGEGKYFIKREITRLKYAEGGPAVKRLWFGLLLILCLLGAFSLPAAALEVDAAAAILIEASTGRIIYQLNAHEALPPASTTKILTALLTLENVQDLDSTTTLPDDFVNVGESGIYLEPGETHTYLDLLYALLLRSANDAAQALAIGVAGSEEKFVEMMNERTAELGLTDSTWANPHGLDDTLHLASAYDLAMIARQAVTHELFNTIISTLEYTMPWPGNDGYDRYLYNYNTFLDVYDGADGIKTGYTTRAGNCLVASATHNGLRLIGVVLNCPNRNDEMAKMMDFGFSNYQAVQVGKAGDVVGEVRLLNARVKKVDVVLGQDVSIPVEQGSAYTGTPAYDFPLALEAPVAADQQIGVATYTDSQGNEIQAPLFVKEGADLYTFAIVFRQAWQRFLSILF